MKPCREWKHEISEQVWNANSVELHTRRKTNGMGGDTSIIPRQHCSACLCSHLIQVQTYKNTCSAKGIIAIGQFAFGIFTLSQFGIGVVSISQFTIAGFALAQFAFAYSLIAQMGIYIHEGHGQIVRSLNELIQMF